jgi:hypothetical protein
MADHRINRLVLAAAAAVADFCNKIGQLRTHAAQQLHLLFDHLVGGRCHRRWHEVFIEGDPANLI